MHLLASGLLVLAGLCAVAFSQDTSPFCDCIQGAMETCKDQVDRPSGGGFGGGGGGGMPEMFQRIMNLSGDQKRSFFQCAKGVKDDMKAQMGGNDDDDQCSPKQCMRGMFGRGRGRNGRGRGRGNRGGGGRFGGNNNGGSRGFGGNSGGSNGGSRFNPFSRFGGRSKRSPGRHGPPQCPDDIEDKTSFRYQMSKCMYDNVTPCFQQNGCDNNRDPCSPQMRNAMKQVKEDIDVCYEVASQGGGGNNGNGGGNNGGGPFGGNGGGPFGGGNSGNGGGFFGNRGGFNG